MASERDASIPSDNEGSEKPVREQLKKAHIAPPPSGAEASVNASSANREDDDKISDQAQQRTSVEDMRDDIHSDASAAATRQHTRKRSRDSTAEEDTLNNGQRKLSGERSREGNEVTESSEINKGANGASRSTGEERPATPELAEENRPESTVGAMMSPKTKRSRLQSSSSGEAAQHAVETDKEDTTKSAGTDAEGGTKSKLLPSSGFANSSAVSPFGALGGSKSPSAEPPQTSSSAFASSGFGTLTGSRSGFGTIGKESGGFGSGGGFASLGSEKEGNAAPASGSMFGGALGQKSALSGTPATAGSFGSAASGFGSLAQPSSRSGFGSGLTGSGFSSVGTIGSLKTFASGKTASPFGSSGKPGKAFGAPAEDDDNEEDDGDENDGSGVKSPLASTEEDRQDERFYEQDLETGEEDETTQYSCRAKLYNFATLPDGKKEWRERGLGVLRLNLRRLPDDQATAPPKARFLMRAEGSHRVVLNTPIQKEIKFGDPAGGAPQGGYMYFMGAVDGASKLEPLQLKMRQQYALELHEKITELQAEM